MPDDAMARLLDYLSLAPGATRTGHDVEALANYYAQNPQDPKSREAFIGSLQLADWHKKWDPPRNMGAKPADPAKVQQMLTMAPIPLIPASDSKEHLEDANVAAWQKYSEMLPRDEETGFATGFRK